MSRLIYVSILLPLLLLTACTSPEPAERDDVASAPAAAEQAVAEAPAEPVAEQRPLTVTEFDFINHAQAGMAEQDVFLADEDGRVLRPMAEQALDNTLASRPVFKTAAPAEHDPFGLSEAPMGPFDQGEPLGFTLGAWMAARGQGTYTTDGESGELELSFENLVPGGVYTIWCATIQMPPDFAVTDRPCGEADGSTNTFTADADGNGAITIPVSWLPETTDSATGVIAAAYHSDGKTYGPLPGEFGSVTHVQLMHMLPPAGVVSDAAASGDEPVTARDTDVTLDFATHVAGGANEQDVYVAGPTEGTVIRISAEQAGDPSYTELVAFSAGEPVKRTPGDLDNIGPFTMGEPLSFTMGEWLGARGEGRFTRDAEGGELTLDFSGLVPDGLYTMWCAELPKAGVEVEGITPSNLPCGAPDGSDNVFTADAGGVGAVTIALDALPSTTAEIQGVVALAYHSDGRNHGAAHGDFGSQTHVQLMHKVTAAETIVSSR